MTVEEFVALETARPPYSGACCVMADRWVEHRRGVSPLAIWGRPIRTDDDVRRWLDEPGGIAVAVNRVMRLSGFAKTKDPAAGDVGLVVSGDEIDGRLPLTMAIKGRSGWYSRNSGGLMMMPHSAVWKAWAI